MLWQPGVGSRLATLNRSVLTKHELKWGMHRAMLEVASRSLLASWQGGRGGHKGTVKKGHKTWRNRPLDGRVCREFLAVGLGGHLWTVLTHLRLHIGKGQFDIDFPCMRAVKLEHVLMVLFPFQQTG